MMKAIVVRAHGRPEVLQVEEVPQPPVGPGQVLVRIKAAGVNPVDTYIRAGTYNTSKLPYTPGFDAAGVVEEVGSGVVDFKPGDRVYTTDSLSGCYAEYALCSAEKIHPFPEQISFEQAAGLNIPYATAYRALFLKAHARPAETVLIHGASGGVGTAAIQWAKAAGLTVIGTAGSEKGISLVRQQGADHALNHSVDGYRNEILTLTQGRGVDLILEMLANVNLGHDLPLLAPHGRVVVIGSRGKVEINPRDTMSREVSIHGMLLFNTPPSEYRSIHAAIYAGIASRIVQPVVGHVFPLTQAPEAHQAIASPGAYGKIILLP